eukprot:scaffold25714_cov30-Tisochrysis_lutea.AAC.4
MSSTCIARISSRRVARNSSIAPSIAASAAVERTPLPPPTVPVEPSLLLMGVESCGARAPSQPRPTSGVPVLRDTEVRERQLEVGGSGAALCSATLGVATSVTRSVSEADASSTPEVPAALGAASVADAAGTAILAPPPSLLSCAVQSARGGPSLSQFTGATA